MSTASFRFSPKILARLGEELNQTADQSIAELVKNAYDADATRCVIELKEIGAAGGTIIVSDDGDGMDEANIRDKWLVLGRSSKSNAELTPRGRIPAGSKGLGRLAALRMGTEVELESIVRGKSRRIHTLSISWDRFDDADVVEDVELQIVTKKNTAGGHGTRTHLRNLRAAVSNDELRRLARSLLLLTDPFADGASGFAIDLIAPEFREIEALLRKKYFDEASYHLHATLDSEGVASAKVLDWQSQELASADLTTLRKVKSVRPYNAPPATLDLWIFLLGSGDGFVSRAASKAEIQAWLRQFGGVYCYQDGIRVSPYGNPGNDWLEMNLSRARSPEERPSTNTSIGRVLLKGSGSKALRQKTDRSGFIEDTNFQELKTFARDALDWLARWRLEEAEKRRAHQKDESRKAVRTETRRIESAIAHVPQAMRAELEKAFVGYERTRDNEAAALRQEIQLYRTLSTAGITAATFSHESHGNPIKRIELGVSALKRRIPLLLTGPERQRLLDPTEDINKAVVALATLGNATLSLIKATKRKVGRVDVHAVLNDLVELMTPFLAGMSTKVQKSYVVANPFMRTSHAALESIFANLVSNALAAFERAGSVDRRIIVSSQIVRSNTLEVVVADSGPGITDLSLTDIWLPGVTGRPDGTGLGLTIVRDTVRDMGGTVEVQSPGRLGGAEFRVLLPILGS